MSAARHAPTAGRRDPFAPLLENPLAAMLRDPDGPGAAACAVPTGGAPLPVTRYADGHERINLGSGNYLGLAGDPRVVEAATDALRRYGTSTSGSRILNGTTGLHLALDEELADFYGTETAVLISSRSTPTSVCCPRSAVPTTCCSSTPTCTPACTPPPARAGGRRSVSATTTSATCASGWPASTRAPASWSSSTACTR